ncbi:MAG: hypothetical protein HYV28_02850 [Ignavibacteriales bacterium]|nr:hypothetical protein [Ignavibacteriales bacterium]
MKTLLLVMACVFGFGTGDVFPQLLPVTPPESRGRIDAERQGMHDANKIRTVFYNYGMLGDYPDDPIGVDLTVFHSVEVPKGSGLNYSDGTTPFVLAKINQQSGTAAYIMETGFRERQGTSPVSNKTMRFEPRPGFFQADPAINKGRSIAMSNDVRTWPPFWPDKLPDIVDPGWQGAWNGYFGKEAKADQESFVVYDDNFYDAWDYFPDTRDNTRRGLGLKVEQRGFQWANPQSGYVIFFHYDIANESTTDYANNIIFGLYMDSGVGGSSMSCDGVAESDDDNAYFDKSLGLNLVYTWDKSNHGASLGNNCYPTGYLGYAYLETPGNPVDAVDNDIDGITNEKRDAGAGDKLVGQDAIRSYVQAHYDMAKFVQYYGSLERRPAYQAGIWWTGDENMNWVAEFDDMGSDGIFNSASGTDVGEKDGIPTSGEPHFDKTDIDESDMIGLTGFKMNRIKAGVGAPTSLLDNVVFFDDGKEWPKRLYNRFTNPDSSFDASLVQNYNIGFLFASGPFVLQPGKTERFSLALGYGKDLYELRTTTKVVQQIYKANYQFAVPPPMPTVTATAGNKFVVLSWDNAAEKAYDPITGTNDFEGYKIFRSTDPAFLDPQIIYTGTGSSPIGNGRPLAQYDLANKIGGYSKTIVEGIAYFLGTDSGIRHTFTDSTVTNGQKYFYAVTAYDRGTDSIEIYPSENAIAVSQTLRGGTILPKNVAEVIPNPPVPGYVTANTNGMDHFSGRGFGSVKAVVANPQAVPEDHLFKVEFYNSDDSVSAASYDLVDMTTKDTLFLGGVDFNAEGTGPVGNGVLPLVSSIREVQIDTANTGYTTGSLATVKYKIRYVTSGLPIQLRRKNYPENIYIEFSDTFADTSMESVVSDANPAKFRIFAKTRTGDVKLPFFFYDPNKDGILSNPEEFMAIATADPKDSTLFYPTWNIDVDTTGRWQGAPVLPKSGDAFNLKLRFPFSKEDVFTFRTKSQSVDAGLAKSEFEKDPYVVPNPYAGAASFEPQRFAVSGRGERKIEFRNIPAGAAIRIYTVAGELVQTLHHDGSITNGSIPWDLRNQDKLEIAPGLYIYHVDGGSTGTFVGKFAVIK